METEECAAAMCRNVLTRLLCNAHVLQHKCADGYPTALLQVLLQKTTLLVPILRSFVLL